MMLPQTRSRGLTKRSLASLLLVSAVVLPRVDAAGEPSLADAVEVLDRARIDSLLEAHADVNARQADGMTALHWAAYLDDAELVERLITRGADAEAANRYGLKPLALACENGNPRTVEALLEAGAHPDATLAGGETMLMVAARVGRTGPVRSLIRRGADVDAKEDHGQTALLWAAAEGHEEVVALLLEAGADWRTSVDSGFNALFFAVREGRTAVVRRLLDAGAHVNSTMERRRPSGARSDTGVSPLTLAVENGHFELAARLLDWGADPNDQRSGYAPLHRITWVRKPNVGDGEDGNPAPIGSGSLTSLDLVRELARHGANVDLRLERGSGGRGRLNRKGATPFFMAAITADAELMRELVSLGADPSIPNADGSSPLLAAAGVGTIAPGEDAGSEPEVFEAVELALELGNDVNAVDKNGETAMHGAAYKNVPSVVELLARSGADVDIWYRENKWGWTPLEIAEGYRVGNFKPSPETVAAFRRVLGAAGASAVEESGRSSPSR